MARKRDDKSNHKGTCDSEKKNAVGQGKVYASLRHQLSAMKLMLREIPGDGNCLFGALADQLDGTSRTHHKHRQDVVAYMRRHREDFEPFVEDNIPFERHLGDLADLGTYGGNECIVAFARLHGVRVVIHQLNAPLWQIEGSTKGKGDARELHISYHNGDHYNSVRRIGDCSANIPNIKLTNVRDETDSSCKTSTQTYTTCGFYEDDLACANSMNPLTETEAEVMNKSGCEDLDVIRSFLEANNYDIHETVDALINYAVHEHSGTASHTISPLWLPDGTGSRVLGTPTNSIANSGTHTKVHHNKKSPQEVLQEKLKNNPNLSNTKKKDIKKQIRKHQNQERKRLQAKNSMRKEETSEDEFGWSPHPPVSEADTIVVKNMECLSI